MAHGEFSGWLESIVMRPRQAERFIKVATEFANTTTSSHLGVNILYEIATMPEFERDKPQQLPSGEVKKPDSPILSSGGGCLMAVMNFKIGYVPKFRGVVKYQNQRC